MQTFWRVLLGSTLFASAAGSGQPLGPEHQPRVQEGDVRYLGSFTLPGHDGTGRGMAESALTWGGFALGIGPDGKSLYFGCHDWGSRLARVTIPAIGETAAIVEPCTEIANLQDVNPGDPNGIKLGGTLWWNGRLVVSAYAYYDAAHSARATHFFGPDLASLTGPVRVGKDPPGMVAGYMGIVPPEWRTLFGGPALTGQCCISIIGRSSYGPSVSVFDPAELGASRNVRSRMLVGYPDAHQTIGRWDGAGPYYGGATSVGGVAFPEGTRSVLFLARRGGTFCYGPGTANASLAGSPDGRGNTWCLDPDGSEDKGVYGYPYRHEIQAYDASELLAVKNGKKNPWQVQPYTAFELSGMSNGGRATLRSSAYDPATRRWYVVGSGGDAAPVVHVYAISDAPGQKRPVARNR